MSQIVKPSFPCDSCGECCRNVNLSDETSFLDRGDGVCSDFDEDTNLCSIYEERPLVCRVKDYYLEKFSQTYEWDVFVKLNLSVCEDLKDRANTLLAE